MDDDRVEAFERELWLGGEDVYRERISRDCVMVVPAVPFLFSGEEAIRAVAGSPRWSQVEFSGLRIKRPEEGLILLAYKANATGGDQIYEAYCTSTYLRFGDSGWRVIQHQQTIALVD